MMHSETNPKPSAPTPMNAAVIWSVSFIYRYLVNYFTNIFTDASNYCPAGETANTRHYDSACDTTWACCRKPYGPTH